MPYDFNILDLYTTDFRRPSPIRLTESSCERSRRFIPWPWTQKENTDLGLRSNLG